MDEQLARMQRLCSGPMSPDQVGLIRDIEAFLEYCVDNGLSFSLALATIAHDVNGLLTNQDANWFQPKVKGYAEKRRLNEAALRQMAADPDLQGPGPS